MCRWLNRSPPRWPARIEAQLTQLIALAQATQQDVEAIEMTLAELKDAVAAEHTVVESAIVLLNGLKTRLEEAIANGLDPAAVQAIADEISANTQELADAITANTPTA